MTFFNIIFMVTCYPILFLMYFMFRNARDRNGWCFGATLSKELKSEPQVEAIDKEYRRKLKNTTIVLGLVPLTCFFVPYMSIAFSIWMIWICVICFYPMVYFAKANKQIQELKRRKTIATAADDDRYWPYGLVYYNKNDTHIMVENRMGSGTAVNVATGVGRGLYIFSSLLMLIIPISCIWLLMLDFTPLSTKVVEHTLVCSHLKVEYEIPIEDIEQYEVVTELPEMTKLMGTAMDTVLSGTYEIYREGKFEAFLNPQNDLFVKIVTEDEMYYISGQSDEDTQAIIDTLEDYSIN